MYKQLYLCIHTFRRVILLNHAYLLFVSNRLHLIKSRLCCFLDMHLYSINLSTIALITALIMSEFCPACFSCYNNFNLSHKSLGSDGKNFVSETPEAESLIPEDLSNFIGLLSLVDLLPGDLHQKIFLLQNHTFVSYPVN